VPNRASFLAPWIGTIGRSERGGFSLSWRPSTCTDLFGFCARSRRICPGIHVAERELWLAISRLLWAFDVRSLPDEPISLEEYEGKSGRTPMPYRIMLIPRHDRVKALVEAEKEVTLMKL
jgi:hypothetical protein